MKARTQNEWLEWYVEHGGSEDLHLSPGEAIFFHPEHGFVSYLIDLDDKVLEIHHMVGDGKFWQKFLVDIPMRFHGLTKLRAFTRRNPKAWMKKYGGHIRGWYMEADIDELKV